MVGGTVVGLFGDATPTTGSSMETRVMSLIRIKVSGDVAKYFQSAALPNFGEVGHLRVCTRALYRLGCRDAHDYCSDSTNAVAISIKPRRQKRSSR